LFFRTTAVSFTLALGCSLILLQPHAEAKGRTIEIVIDDHGFSPKQITSPLDQPVHLKILNKGKQIHEYAIPDYRIYSRNLGPGESSDIEFSPWQAGSFVMYSDPSADQAPEFSGRFIVLKPEPNPSANQSEGSVSRGQ
jgi:hypothetical protein